MFLRVLLFLLALGMSRLTAAELPRVDKGRLDLRAVDLNQDITIDLSGDWEFYWDRLLASEKGRDTTSAPDYRIVPLPWSESRPGYPAYPAFGKATWRLHILLPQQHPALLLRIPETFTAFNIFINGQPMPVKSKAGTDAASTHASRRTVYVPIDSALSEIDLVYEVANYVSGTGGVWRTPSLGNTEAIMETRSQQQFQMLLAVSALGVMSAYHLILWLFRREHRDNLWFSLFCCAIFTRSFLVGNDIMLYNLVTDFDWTWSRRIEFISFYWAVGLSIIFIKELFPEDMKSALMRFLLSVIAIATLIVLTQPHVIFRKTLLIMQIVGIISILTSLFCIILALKRRRPQARTMMLGFLFMASGTVHDILNSMLRFDTLELASISVIGCVITTSIVISKRFSLTFDQLREAQESIRMHNEQLDQLVKEKTRDIRSIFSSIPQGIFAIQRDGRLNAEVSDYFRDLFQPEPQMRARDLLHRIFEGSQLTADEMDQIINAVDFCLDGKSLSFELNRPIFPQQLLCSIEGQKRTFEMDWNPIIDENDQIQKLLICMRDTTEINELRIKTLESEKRVKIVAELLDKDHGPIMTWLHEAIRELESMLDLAASGQDKPETITRETLRRLHTQKGNARGLGLTISASSVHACEQDLLDQELAFTEVLARLLHELTFTRDVLKSLTSRSSASSSLCLIVAMALEQLAPLAQRLQKERPETHGLDLLEAHGLQLSPALDYTVRGALNHVLTNIMDHGLEPRDERVKAGKPPRGHIAFYLHEGDAHWVLQISDDGRGLPREAIERKLRAAGRTVPKDTEALAQVLLENGFSTKDRVNDLSGRGLGLDAVAAALKEAGGALTLHTRERAPGADPQLVFCLSLPKSAVRSSQTQAFS